VSHVEDPNTFQSFRHDYLFSKTVLLLRTGAHRRPCEMPILTSQESVHNHRDRKVLVLESYGMTEASHQMASNPLPPEPRKAGKVRYGFGVEVGMMDDSGKLMAQGEIGEVVVKGANVVDGYENNPEANKTAFTNGWFRTGDQGGASSHEPALGDRGQGLG